MSPSVALSIGMRRYREATPSISSAARHRACQPPVTDPASAKTGASILLMISPAARPPEQGVRRHRTTSSGVAFVSPSAQRYPFPSCSASAQMPGTCESTASKCLPKAGLASNHLSVPGLPPNGHETMIQGGPVLSRANGGAGRIRWMRRRAQGQPNRDRDRGVTCDLTPFAVPPVPGDVLPVAFGLGDRTASPWSVRGGV